MRGHIEKKRGRYYLVIELEKDPRTGRRRRRWQGGFEKKKEAEAALIETLGRIDKGTYVLPSKVTLREFLHDEWLPAIRAEMRPNTLESYREIVDAYLVPALGNIRLQDLAPSHLKTLYGVLADQATAPKKALSPRTIRYVHVTLHRALQDAVNWGRVPTNVAARVRPPKPRRPTMETWEADELRAFLLQVQGDRLYAAWILAATTGMRRSEVLGLHWRDISLDAARLAVRHALVLVDGRPALFEPKTAKGRRSVPLPPETVAALRAHRTAQLQERLAAGPAYQDSDIVFCQTDGHCLSPRGFTDMFQRRAKAAGVRRIELRELRHTFATLALRAGVHPKVVSEILGHANISITLDTYSHAIPAMQEEAAAKVADLIFRPSI